MEQLILDFSGQEILEAARSIPDSDLSLREDSKKRLAAYVGDTTVDIDFEQRIVVHRCPVWSRSISEKRLCPHIVKVFLSINPERSRSVLSLVHSTLDSWKFESRLAVEFPT